MVSQEAAPSTADVSVHRVGDALHAGFDAASLQHLPQHRTSLRASLDMSLPDVPLWDAKVEPPRRRRSSRGVSGRGSLLLNMANLFPVDESITPRPAGGFTRPEQASAGAVLASPALLNTAADFGEGGSSSSDDEPLPDASELERIIATFSGEAGEQVLAGELKQNWSLSMTPSTVVRVQEHAGAAKAVVGDGDTETIAELGIPPLDGKLNIAAVPFSVGGFLSSMQKFQAIDAIASESRARANSKRIGRPKLASLLGRMFLPPIPTKNSTPRLSPVLDVAEPMAGSGSTDEKNAESGEELDEDPVTTVRRLLEVDVAAFGLEWTRQEKIGFAMSAALHIVVMILLATLAPPQSAAQAWDFWQRVLVEQAILLVIFTVCGLAVVTYGFNTAYSRKICHLALFVLPFVIVKAWPLSNLSSIGFLTNALWAIWASYIPFYLQIKPVRRMLTWLLVLFRAIDREQDRPYTLLWGLTQSAAGFAVLLPLYTYLWLRGAAGHTILIFIPILVNGIGDGLAEPVGVAWGRHRYQTRAIFYNGKFCSGSFSRSLEGSSCVLISGFVFVAIFSTILSTPQLIFALLTMPLAYTFAEAFSPHTWDTPFLFFVGGLLLIVMEECFR